MIFGLKNKRAQLGEQMMFFVFIFLMIVIGGGIAIGLLAFTGDEFDYKNVGADVLSERIASCLKSGALSGIESMPKEDLNNFIMQRCTLNSDIISSYNQIKICANSNDCINAQNPVFSTGRDFIACNLTGGEKFLGCATKDATWGGNEYTIIATNSQKIRRVS